MLNSNITRHKLYNHTCLKWFTMQQKSASLESWPKPLLDEPQRCREQPEIMTKIITVLYMYNSDFIRQLWESNKNTSYTNYFTWNAVLNTVQWKNSKQKHWDLWDRDKATERRQMYKKRDRLFLTTWNFHDHLFCDFEAHIFCDT